MGISKVDKNFKMATSLKEEDIVFYDIVDDNNIDLYGLYKPKETKQLKRIPLETAQMVSEGVTYLHDFSSGGRIRLKTNSRYIAVKVEYKDISIMPHMPLSGSAGFDIYEVKNTRSLYHRTFIPTADIPKNAEFLYDFCSQEVRDLVIYMPLYASVTKVYIGLQETASLDHGEKYSIDTPVLYYGSSITQGGCASRTSNSYQGFVSRALDCDFINLGFSGNARGERVMSEFIASHNMSAFVLDYDHNAPSVEHLKLTHKPLFDLVRAKHPNLPIIMMTKPDFDSDIPQAILRRDVVYQTYIQAKQNGDKNVYFIDGYSLFGDDERDACTVDKCHPNDLGFYRMAQPLIRILGEVL